MEPSSGDKKHYTYPHPTLYNEMVFNQNISKYMLLSYRSTEMNKTRSILSKHVRKDQKLLPRHLTPLVEQRWRSHHAHAEHMQIAPVRNGKSKRVKQTINMKLKGVLEQERSLLS